MIAGDGVDHELVDDAAVARAVPSGAAVVQGGAAAHHAGAVRQIRKPEHGGPRQEGKWDNISAQCNFHTFC